MAGFEVSLNGRFWVSPEVISGQIGVCTVNVTSQRRQVMSKFVVPNPNHEALRQQIQNYDSTIDDCKRQNGANHEVACKGLRDARQQLRNRLSNEPPAFTRDYSYMERPITVAGQMRMTLQIDESILRGTRPVGEPSATLNENCVERQGVREDDWSVSSSSSFGGLLAGLLGGQPRQRVENATCPEVSREGKLLTMAQQLADQAQRQAATAIRAVAGSYLELAKRATDHDVALENYISFALLTADKSGPEYQQALTAIHGRDADLKPETALR